MKPNELKEIANKVNEHKQVKNKKINELVEEVLEAAKISAENGKYTLSVDTWCGDYVPLAGEVCRELEKLGFTIYTGAGYSYYITWK